MINFFIESIFKLYHMGFTQVYGWVAFTVVCIVVGTLFIPYDPTKQEKGKKEKISSLEKILEIIGINEPGKKLEKIFQVMNVKGGDVTQGSLDIQAMYDELQKTLKKVGLSKISDSTKEFLKSTNSN